MIKKLFCLYSVRGNIASTIGEYVSKASISDTISGAVSSYKEQTYDSPRGTFSVQPTYNNLPLTVWRQGADGKCALMPAYIGIDYPFA